MDDPKARSDFASESGPITPVEHGDGHPVLSIPDGDLLARQIAALDGISYAQAFQQIREMMGFDLGSYPRPTTIYNQWKTARALRSESLNSPLAGKRPAGSSSARAEEIARDLRAVERIEAIPTLLDVLCDTTGMRFAAIARVTDDRWIACAVKDRINFGLKPGGEFDVNSTLRIEPPAAQAPIVIDHASMDHRYSTLGTPRLFGIESYISVPVIMPGGRYFGNLCAIDPAPSKVSDPRILSMFKRFAQLIGQQLDDELTREMQLTALSDERAASELREQFIAILGHDLRNPLHAVFATGDLLERRLDDPTLIDMAARIKTNARRMSALIDDVLDFARGRLGSGIGLQISEADDFASDLLAVIRELQDAHPEREILASINITRKVRCDVGRVQQLASNLVANALIHGSSSSPVRVSASTEGESLSFSVWNDGEPIPESSIGKVFEPFWRNTTSTNREGLGLGLYICSQIVRAHHGRLSVTSTRGGGTFFIAHLPMQCPSSASKSHGSRKIVDIRGNKPNGHVRPD
jgi:signal transduction histidine kinase